MAVNLTWKDVSQSPYSGSIEKAINGQASPFIAPVQPGDTIYVPGGNYNIANPLLINQPNVRIVGDGMDKTNIICPSGSSIAVFDVTESFATLEGFTITQADAVTSGTGVGVRIGSSATYIQQTTLRHIKIKFMPSYALFIPGGSEGFSNQPVNETVIENAILHNSQSDAIVFIGKGSTLANFRNCNISAYHVPGVLAVQIMNASHITFDSCEGNPAPDKYWLDFEVDPNDAAPTSGGEALSIINCDLEVNREEPGAVRHSSYFIHAKRVSHVLIQSTLLYWAQKGVWLEECNNAIVQANVFIDIRANGNTGANPAASSLTLTACKDTAIIGSCWQNTDYNTDWIPDGTVTGERLPLPFEELSGTTGTTVLEQGVALLPTYGAVASSLPNNVKTGLLHPGMLAYDLKRRLQSWDGAKWVRAVTGYELFIATDYADIQLAVDAASAAATGGVVYVPGATYNESSTPKYSGNLIVNAPGKTIRIIGDGAGSTILQAPSTGPNNDKPMLSLRSDDIAIEGMTFDGFNQVSTAAGIVIGNAGQAVFRPRMTDVTVRNSAGWSIYALGSEAAASSHYGLFERVRCTGNRSAATGGVWLAVGCSTHVFRDCVVEQFKGYGVFMDQVDGAALLECRIFDASDDTQPYLGLNNSLNIIVTALKCRNQAPPTQTQNERFIKLTGENRSISIIAPKLYRDQTSNPNGSDVNSGGGIARSVMILSPEMRVQGAATGTDHIKIGSSSECFIIGGVVSASGAATPFPVMEIESPASRFAVAGRATIDFGNGAQSATVSVSDLRVATNSRIMAAMAYAPTLNRDLDELEMDHFEVHAGNVTNGVGFEIVADCLTGYGHGTYFVDYIRS